MAASFDRIEGLMLSSLTLFSLTLLVLDKDLVGMNRYRSSSLCEGCSRCTNALLMLSMRRLWLRDKEITCCLMVVDRIEELLLAVKLFALAFSFYFRRQSSE